MKAFIFSILLAVPVAHARTVIEAGPSAGVALARGEIALSFSGIPAARLFDALTVSATPGWEDVQVASKSARGLYCSDELAPSGRFTSCEFRLSAADGFNDAVWTGRSDVQLSFDGEIAGRIYDALSVSEVGEDTEGFTFSKAVNGLSCQRFPVTNLYRCLISVDPAQGVLH